MGALVPQPSSSRRACLVWCKKDGSQSTLLILDRASCMAGGQQGSHGRGRALQRGSRQAEAHAHATAAAGDGGACKEGKLLLRQRSGCYIARRSALRCEHAHCASRVQARTAEQPAPAAVEPAGGVSEQEIVSFLRAAGLTPLSEVTAKFKPQLHTPEHKAAFTRAVKKVARLEEVPPGSGKRFIVLREA